MSKFDEGCIWKLYDQQSGGRGGREGGGEEMTRERTISRHQEEAQEAVREQELRLLVHGGRVATHDLARLLHVGLAPVQALQGGEGGREGGRAGR